MKLFENNLYSNQFSYNTSYFESRVSNSLHSEPFSQNSKNCESKVLERVMFRKKMFYTASDFEVELICTKTDFDECFVFKKSILDLLTPWKRQLSQLCIFSKTNNWWKKKKEKTVLLSKLLKRIRFWSKFLTTRQTWNQEVQNTSGFSSTQHNSSFFEPEFLQCVGLWNIFFTTPQILNRSFNNAIDFHVKLALKNKIRWDNSAQKFYYFLVNLHLKNV